MRASLVAFCLFLTTCPVVAQTPALTWTTELSTPNAPGYVEIGGIDGAPNGDLCAASKETLDGARTRAVVRRYGPDGTERWAHAVDAWTAPQDVFEVFADGPDCLVSTRFFTTGPFSVGGARVGPGGVTFAAQVGVASRASAVFVRPDGTGGAWLGIGGTELPAVLVRIDASGEEVARVERPDGAGPSPLGVRDFAVTPDGRAVATTTGDHLLVVELDGTVETAVPLAGDLPSLALAPDGADGVFVFATDGLDGAGQRFVRRYTLDGVHQWSTTLGPQGDPEDLRPHALLAADGDAVVVWTDDGDLPRAARLSGATGDVLWTEVIGDRFARPHEITLAPGGAAVHLDALRPSLVALNLSDGTVRWTEEIGIVRDVFPAERILAACGAGACTQTKRVPAGGPINRLTVTARDADGAEVWQTERVGAPVPNRVFSDAVVAPGGGLYAFGTEVSTGTDGRTSNGFLAARFDEAGTLLWATSLGGSLFADPATSDGIVLLPDGDIVVAGRVDTGVVGLPVVTRLAPDGTVVRQMDVRDTELHRQTSSGSIGVTGIAVAPDGSVTASVATGGVPGPHQFVHFDPAGDVVWRAELDDDAYPLGIRPTDDGAVALVTDRFAFLETALSVVRIGPDGTLTPGGTFAQEACPGYVPDPVFEVDAAGTVTMVATCGDISVVRFAPDGMVSATQIAPTADWHRALDLTLDGDAVVTYESGSDHSGVVRLRPDGSTAWDTGLTLSGTTPDVAALASGGALSLRIAPDDDGVDEPSVFTIHPDGGLTSISLPRPGGLASDRGVYSPTARIVPDGDGAAYMMVLGSHSPIEIPSVSRVEGLPVASEGGPADSAPRLLRLAGANPVAAGAPLRLALDAPATVDLVDALGRRLARWDFGAGEQMVAAPSLSPGLYLIRARSGDTSETLRVIVR